MKYSVCTAKMADLPRIEALYGGARAFMAAHGNPTQWGTAHPPVSQLKKDIEQGRLYILTDDSGIHGVFYFFIGTDPTYGEIFNGKWHSDMPYGTIHRIAGDGSGGILRSAVAFCSQQIKYLRIDTHADNRVMQQALKKLGFQPCGIIYTDDGSPRIAYDLLMEEEIS